MVDCLLLFFFGFRSCEVEAELEAAPFEPPEGSVLTIAIDPELQVRPRRGTVVYYYSIESFRVPPSSCT